MNAAVRRDVGKQLCQYIWILLGKPNLDKPPIIDVSVPVKSTYERFEKLRSESILDLWEKMKLNLQGRHILEFKPQMSLSINATTAAAYGVRLKLVHHSKDDRLVVIIDLKEVGAGKNP